MFGKLHEHRKNLIHDLTPSRLSTTTGRSTAIAIVLVIPWAWAATICSWTDVTALTVSWATAVGPHRAPAVLPWCRAPAAIRGGAPRSPLGR
jgi:hypothetical protein